MKKYTQTFLSPFSSLFLLLLLLFVTSSLGQVTNKGKVVRPERYTSAQLVSDVPCNSSRVGGVVEVTDLDKTTKKCVNTEGVTYKWLNSSPPQSLVHSQIDDLSVGYEVGVEFTTCGFAACGDRGGATYKVQASASPFTVDGYGAISLANGNVAIMQSQMGDYNALAFGVVYHASTDSTTALQRALDWQSQNARTGRVFFPESLDGEFIRFSKVYVKSGGWLFGQGISSLRTAPTTTTRYGAKFKVLTGGLGFVCGASSHNILNTAINITLENLYIEGATTAISGVRLGSDVSYKGTFQHSVIRNCEIRGFTSNSAVQPIYDQSTAALGSGDSDYFGTFPITGAAGVMVANAVNSSLENLVLEENYYGIAESSGGKSTTLRAKGGYWSQNVAAAIYFTTLKSSTFENVVIEGNNAEAVILKVPTTSTAELKTQMYGLFFNYCHFEQNNLQRRDNGTAPKTYTFVVNNENSGASIRDIYINSSISAPYGHAFYSQRGRNILITGRLDVASGDDAMATLNSENNYYTNEIQSTAVFNIDSGTLLTRSYFAENPKYYGKMYGRLRTDGAADVFQIENNSGTRIFEMSTNAGGNLTFDIKNSAGTNRIRLNASGDSYFSGGRVCVGCTSADASFQSSPLSDITIGQIIKLQSGHGVDALQVRSDTDAVLGGFNNVGKLFLGASGTRGVFTGTFTANRNITFPDASITVARSDASQTFTGDQTFAGDVISSTAGKSIQIKTGSNACAGWATLSSGTVTVSTACIGTLETNTGITLTPKGSSTGVLRISSSVADTSFTITSTDATSSDKVYWQITKLN